MSSLISARSSLLADRPRSVPRRVSRRIALRLACCVATEVGGAVATTVGVTTVGVTTVDTAGTGSTAGEGSSVPAAAWQRAPRHPPAIKVDGTGKSLAQAGRPATHPSLPVMTMVRILGAVCLFPAIPTLRNLCETWAGNLDEKTSSLDNSPLAQRKAASGDEQVVKPGLLCLDSQESARA